eukprot:gnl/TRDRNA2_/TRDRNA2_173344_c2_seq2.p1 gnl/TRDRNA2_/TRDRNA2_173344_c2~~gnl/TRDRNA2_/TRDRNA2_173344_c2_seq2.p1  ORF type:complete len:147 (-),score=1.39 gnl/TRDRNA2_/TRDRNA2_173344_c2_seq2:32-472(-)
MTCASCRAPLPRPIGFRCWNAGMSVGCISPSTRGRTEQAYTRLNSTKLHLRCLLCREEKDTETYIFLLASHVSHPRGLQLLAGNRDAPVVWQEPATCHRVDYSKSQPQYYYQSKLQSKSERCSRSTLAHRQISQPVGPLKALYQAI